MHFPALYRQEDRNGKKKQKQKNRQDLEPSVSWQLWENRVQMTQECRYDEGFLWQLKLEKVHQKAILVKEILVKKLLQGAATNKDYNKEPMTREQK